MVQNDNRKTVRLARFGRDDGGRDFHRNDGIAAGHRGPVAPGHADRNIVHAGRILPR